MASSNPTTLNHGQNQVLPDEEETTYSTPRFRLSMTSSTTTRGGRASSFSLPSPSNDSWGRSSFDQSPSFYFNEEFTPTFNPSTLNPLHFNGIPFSWEEIPGIPKHQDRPINYKKESSRSNLLPLPPPAGSSSIISSTKKVHNQEEISPKKHHDMIGNTNFQRWDPFFAALIECSKDDNGHDHGTKSNVGNISSKNIITRTLSDRLGFVSMYNSCKRTCAVSESIVYLPRSNPHPNYLLDRRSS